MKKILITAFLIAAAAPTLAVAGVSVNIGEPGFFGRIDIGGSPRPQVIESRPIIVDRARVVEEPVYVRVPVEERSHWRDYCGRYDACGRPVYFVRDDWYQNTYAPRYRQRHRDPNHDYSDDAKDHRDHDYSDDRADHEAYRREHGGH